MITVKFAFAVPVALYTYDLSYWETVLFLLSGGFLGIVFFGFLTKTGISLWKKYIGETAFERKFTRFLRKLLARGGKKKKVFSRRNKLIVKTKLVYGLFGIAFLTPVVLSLPFGTFLAFRYYPSVLRTFLVLYGAVVLWAFILVSAFSWFA